MSNAVSTTVRRWLVPSAAALAVIGGGVAIGLVTNAADPARAPRSAQDLLVGLQTAEVDGLQGTVTLRTDLGLPMPVPSLGSAEIGSLASGTHTLRVWYADPGQARIALIGRDSETDLITNGKDVWLWSSAEQSAVHATLAEGGLAGLLSGGMFGDQVPGRAYASLPPSAPALPGLAGLDPDMVARLVLTVLEQFDTDVTTDNSATVAGRDAYELTIAPRDTRSLIKAIVIDVDAETDLPLRLAVLARDGGAPAFEVAFTELSLTKPDPAQFEFNPPPGTTVTEADEIDLSGALPIPHMLPEFDVPAPDESTGPRFAFVGSGWTTVLAVRIPDHPDAEGAEAHPLADMIALLPPASGDWGSGHVLKTRLFSVLVTDDGRVLAGAVAPEALYAAAADPAAKLGS